jgi:hypothetical protein
VPGIIVGGPIYTTAGSRFSGDERERRAAGGLGERIGFIPFHADPVDGTGCSTWWPEPEPGRSRSGLPSPKRWPAVVTAAGGRRSCSTRGTTGRAAPGDASWLAEAIARLAGEVGLRARLGANARRTAVARFSQDRHGREIAAA